MSGVAIALQGLLSLLLVAALAYGVRLERKLRDLRESQSGFAKAVQELNQAAGRAEVGLQSLRQSTEVAREELADRIDAARTLTARLEAAASDAALAVKRLEAARSTSFPLDGGRWPRGAGSDGGEPASARPSEAPLPSRASSGETTPIRRSAPPSPIQGEGSPNRRPRSDEDLFAAAQPAATAASRTERLRQVAELLRAPAAAGGRP